MTQSVATQEVTNEPTMVDMPQTLSESKEKED